MHSQQGLGCGFGFDLEHIGQGEADAAATNFVDRKPVLLPHPPEEHTGYPPALTEFCGGEERGEGFFRDIIFHSVLCCHMCDASHRWQGLLEHKRQNAKRGVFPQIQEPGDSTFFNSSSHFSLLLNLPGCCGRGGDTTVLGVELHLNHVVPLGCQ